MVRPIILSLIASLLVGCGTKTIYVRPEIALPDWPELPVVASSEFIPTEIEGNPYYLISRNTYSKLAQRETLRRRYAEELRALIVQHNEKADP